MCRLLVETVRYKRFTEFISTCLDCVKGFRISQAANSVIVSFVAEIGVRLMHC